MHRLRVCENYVWLFEVGTPLLGSQVLVCKKSMRKLKNTPKGRPETDTSLHCEVGHLNLTQRLERKQAPVKANHTNPKPSQALVFKTLVHSSAPKPEFLCPRTSQTRRPKALSPQRSEDLPIRRATACIAWCFRRRPWAPQRRPGHPTPGDL